MPLTLKPFQEEICAGIVARFDTLRAQYDVLRGADPAALATVRRNDGAVVLQAPTGAGKTLIAVEALRRFATTDKVLWFWFAPFAGLVEQSRLAIEANAPSLRLFDLATDRRPEAVLGGGMFVSTWAAVAARSADSRRARTDGDDGLAIDTVITQARAAGLRIGCVVDEAHHGFHHAAQARAFYTDVLAPDYTLMMTATPRDADALAFARDTGWRVGEPADWASVSRADAVAARLLKRGVRMVRFVARDGDATQLIDFEHLALRECTAMHRAIGDELAAQGVALTPLMLVQVPDGAQAQKDAQKYLVDSLGFAESAVRVHTANEPDPDLLALANDPSVEVLIFKMAVALGFDAPRAFTLAALRGARDAGFGVQVIGRIVRRHALLQAREPLPPLLDHGYVFLANSASQEGLLDAGQQINALTTRAPELGTQTVVTVIGDTQQVQVVRSGEPLSLPVTAQGAEAVGTASGEAQAGDVGGGEFEVWSRAARDLLQQTGDEGSPSAAVTATRIAPEFALASHSQHRYPRRADAPASLRSERLPAAPEDFEARLAAHVDFSHAVLADRLRSNVRVVRSETDLFDGRSVGEGSQDVWANLEPAAVAEKAEQIRLRLPESNDRELYTRLLRRFAEAIRHSGAPVESDEELLSQQLDLVLVRNPLLLRAAYKRMQHQRIIDVDAPLPAELHSDIRLDSARRGLYGVFPPDMNADERAVAERLDGNALVRWWHRNPSDARRPDALGLYRWDDGVGFFPDFVVSLDERKTPGGIALLEVKGHFLWRDERELDKAEARHGEYGGVFFVGRRRDEREFMNLRKLGDKLDTAGDFSIDTLRYA